MLLLVFNLIPAFPLDGGRIARATAWKLTGDRGRATRFAARLGRGFAFLMIAGGVLIVVSSPANLITGVWLGFVGWFLGQAARQAEVQTEVTSRIEGLRVADVMDDDPVGIPASLTIDRALDEFFLRYRYPWFPVVDEAGHFTGLVTYESVNAVLESERATRTVESVMAPDTPESAEGGLRVGLDEPLEALLGREVLQRLGAIVAVDPEGRLAGRGHGRPGPPRARSPVAPELALSPRAPGTPGERRAPPRSPAWRRDRRRPACRAPAWA